MTENDKDTPVEGAQPRSDELIDALEEVKETPPEPGGDWPDIGQPGGEARVGTDKGRSPAHDNEDAEAENHEGPLAKAGDDSDG